jgi:predicted membrane protein
MPRRWRRRGACLDQYVQHPFAVTFALLLPALTWLVIAVGLVELLRLFPLAPLPADPGLSFTNGVLDGVLIGTVATAATAGLVYLIRRRAPK